MWSDSDPFDQALVASALAHAALLWLLWGTERPKPPPEPRILQVEMRSLGARPDEVAGEVEAAGAEAPAPTPEPVVAKTQRPSGRSAPVAPVGEVAPLPRPAPPAAPSTPRSFASWRQSRLGKYTGSVRDRPFGGGTADGRDAATSRGRDRCEPSEGRAADRVFLLFDSSGSMDSNRQRQAITCARQYAKAALARGATVIVGNFAGKTVFSQPTRDLTDVDFALRGGVDPRATILPTKELNPFLGQDPGALSDLIIVSDGYIPNYRDVTTWYRYFLEMNPDNHGVLFTVGSPGHPDVIRAFRDLGFSVYVYQVL